MKSDLNVLKMSN